MTHVGVIEIFRSYNDRYKKILKANKARKGNGNYKQQLEQLRKDADKLLDITKCKCIDFVMSDKCTKADKVPVNEGTFLLDQKWARKMLIRGIDLVEANKLQKNIQERKWIKKALSQHSARTNEQQSSSGNCLGDKDDSTDTSDEEDTILGTL